VFFSPEQLNLFLALGVVALQGAAVILLVLFFLRTKPSVAPLLLFLKKRGLLVALLLTLGAIAVTLYHSTVVGILPCPLCYIQRIFLYPQAVLFALALWKRDSGIADYSIALSIGGAAIALYQHLLQMNVVSAAPCSVNGADCAARIFFEFGYITYPLMAFSVFAFLIALMLHVRRGAHTVTAI